MFAFSGKSVQTLVTIQENLYVGIKNEGVFRLSDGDWFDFSTNIGNKNIKDLHVFKDEYLIANTNLGFYISEDLGASWDTASFGIEETITSIDNLGDGLVSGTNLGGVYLSGDTAKSWTQSNNGLSGYRTININSIEVSDSLIFIATNSGVYVSTDSCKNWSGINEGLNNMSVSDLLVVDNKLFAATTDTIYSTEISNYNWTKTNGMSSNYTSLLAKGDNIYSGTKSGIRIFEAQGKSWANFSIGLARPNAYFLEDFYNVSYLFNANGSYKSEDRNEWELYTITGLTTNKVKFIKPVGNKMIIGTSDKGVFISEDTLQSCLQITTNPSTSSNVRGIMGSDTLLFIATNEGIFSSADTGKTWTNHSLLMTEKDFVDIAFLNDSLYALATKKLYVSGDFGESWDPIDYSSIWSIGATSYHSIAATDTGLLVTFSTSQYGDKLFASNSTIDSWTNIYPRWDEMEGTVGNSCKLYEFNGGIISLGNNNGTKQVNICHDGGIAWSRIGNGLSGYGGSLSSINVSNSGDTLTMITSTGHIFVRALPIIIPETPTNFKYTQSDDTFSAIWDDNSDIETGFCLVVPINYNLDCVGENITEYVTTNRSILGAQIYANNNGDYSLPSEEIVRAEDETNSVVSTTEKEELEIYPNPANDYLIIEYDSNVKPLGVKVYNIAGEILYEDYDCLHFSGSYALNTSEYKPGMYILSVVCKDNVINKQFLKR